MPSRVWCKRGHHEPLALVIPTSFFFSRLFLLLFVSLIGLTDHSSLTYSPGGMLGSQEINTVAKERRAVGAKSSKVRLFSKHTEK